MHFYTKCYSCMVGNPEIRPGTPQSLTSRFAERQPRILRCAQDDSAWRAGLPSQIEIPGCLSAIGKSRPSEFFRSPYLIA